MATQQDVIKAFMRSLDNTTKSGADALDEAIRSCSNGKFSSMQNLIDCFIRDVKKYGGTYINDSKTESFLKNYCGINLNNTDTGSISGSDAGGAKAKTAESIVPESGSVVKFPSSGKVTINGLTITCTNLSKLSADERAIADRLYTWWAKGALDLIQQSFGMNFQESGTTVKSIDLKFESNSNTSSLAHVTNSYNPYTGKTDELTLTVNMAYYKGFNKQDVNGASKNSSAGYLDRTLAHEFVHAVMGANVTHFANLPLFVKEGLAELVHGIDDERSGEIRTLATTGAVDYLKDLFSIRGTYYNCGNDSYAGGYMLFRYLAKQVATSSASTTKPKKNSAGVTYNSNKTAVTIVAPFSGTWDAAKYASTVRTIDASKDTNSITIKAGKYNNTIKASKKGSNIYGQGGNDTIYGGAAKDVFWYGSGDGADTIYSFQSGTDVLRFYNKGKIDSVTTSGTNVVLNSGKGSIKLVGKANQRVDITDTAGKNAVYYFGRQDKANTFVYRANYRYYGSTKYNDTLQVNTGATVSLASTSLYHSVEVLDATRSKKAVKLTGGAKTTTLYGSNQNDTLTAGAGGANLHGGKGNDSLYGGKGKDKFFWGSCLGNDVVYNYESNKDIIVFKAGSFKSGKGSGQDVVLTSNAGNTITLKNAAGKTIILQDTKGKQTKKSYKATAVGNILPSGVSYNSKTMTVKLSKGTVTDFSLSGNHVILKSTVGNIRIANAKGKILSVVNGNGVKATYKVTANFPSGSGFTYNSNKTEALLGRKCDFSAGEINYASSVVTINGTATTNSGFTIWGTGSNNTIIAGSGDMDLCGSFGNDKLYGGKGKNVFYWDKYYGNDVIYNYTKGQDSIRLFGGRIDSYAVSGNDVILKSGSATLIVKDTKPADVTVYNSDVVRDTYWYNKKLPAGVSYDKSKNSFVLNTSYTACTFGLDGNPLLAQNVDARALNHSVSIFGDFRDNVIYTSNYGDSVSTGTGKDTVYLGKGKDEVFWLWGNSVIYNYTKGKDRIYAYEKFTHSTSGRDLILKGTNTTLTLKNTKWSDVTIVNSSALKTFSGTSAVSCKTADNKASISYLYDVANIGGQQSKADVMSMSTFTTNYTSSAQKLALVQAKNQKLPH